MKIRRYWFDVFIKPFRDYFHIAVAPESLWKAIQGLNSQSKIDIDNTIYFYLPDEVFDQLWDRKISIREVLQIIDDPDLEVLQIIDDPDLVV